MTYVSICTVIVIIDRENSSLSLNNDTVNANQANGTVVAEGGGIYTLDSTLTLVSTNVKGNKATTAYNNIFDGP